MRHVFIINPAAGRHDMSSVTVKRIEAACYKHRLEYDIYLTAHPMHAVDIVKKVGKSHEGSGLIFYACGGDGTLNEVATGVSELEGDCAFTSYPIGTGNDYVKMFSGGKQAFLDLDRLLYGDPVDIDYIRSDCGCAINVLSVGLDAQVAMRKDKYRFLGGGIFPYVLSAAESVVRGIGQEYYVNIDGRQFDGEYTMIFIGNGRFYGGGFCPVPHSNIGDGILDVLLVKKISRLQAAFVVNKYKKGRYRELERFLTYMPAKEIKVFSKNNEDMCINLDGETVQSSHISMRVEPQKLRFIIPKGAFPVE